MNWWQQGWLLFDLLLCLMSERYISGEVSGRFFNNRRRCNHQLDVRRVNNFNLAVLRHLDYGHLFVHQLTIDTTMHLSESLVAKFLHTTGSWSLKLLIDRWGNLSVFEYWCRFICITKVRESARNRSFHSTKEAEVKAIVLSTDRRSLMLSAMLVGTT